MGQQLLNLRDILLGLFLIKVISKKVQSLAILFFFVLFQTSLYADPLNFKVVEGDVEIVSTSNKTTFNTNSKTVIIETPRILLLDKYTWQIVAPTGNKAVFRATGSQSGIFAGHLDAPTSVVAFISPSGLHIKNTATMNTQAFIASTLDISNELLMSQDQFVFSKTSSQGVGSILNEANLKVKDGGYVVFLAETIRNEGVVEANKGSVVFATGQKATLNFDQDGFINVIIDKGVEDKIAKEQVLIDNTSSGKVIAEGGKVTFNAKTLNTVFDRVVNNSGLVQATRMVNRGGVIEFVSDGENWNDGTVKATTFEESGYTFGTTGAMLVENAFYENADGAVKEFSGTVSGNHYDTGDIRITGALTLLGDTTFGSDSFGDGSAQGDSIGNFTMQAGSSINGGGHNLTIYGAGNVEYVIDPDTGIVSGGNYSRLTNISNVNNLSFGDRGQGVLFYYGANGSVAANNNITFGANVRMIMESDMDLIADADNNGTGAILMDSSVSSRALDGTQVIDYYASQTSTLGDVWVSNLRKNSSVSSLTYNAHNNANFIVLTSGIDSNVTFNSLDTAVLTEDFVNLGTWNAGDAVIATLGDWDHSSGVFNVSNDTTVLFSVRGGEILDVDMGSNHLSHVWTNTNTGSGSRTIRLQNDIDVRGDFHLLGGAFGDYTFSANGHEVEVDGDASISLRQDPSTSDTHSGSPTYSTGSGKQTFNQGLDIESGTINQGAGEIEVNGLFDLDGGIFNGNASGTLDLNAGFDMDGGSFNAPNLVTVAGGGWDIDGGTFSHQNRTVTFDGSGTHSIDHFGRSFFNLNHSGSSTLNMSTNLSVLGTFNNSNGVFNANGFTSTISGVATISGGTYQGGSSKQTFNDDLVLSGGDFTAGTGEVEINGGDLTINSGTFDGDATGIVDLNGSLVMRGGDLLAPGNMFVQGNWDNDGGNVVHRGNTVTFDGSSGTSTVISGGELFGNLIVDESDNSGNYTVSFQDSARVTVDLTLRDGNIIGPNGAASLRVDRDFVTTQTSLNQNIQLGSGDLIVNRDLIIREGAGGTTTFTGGSGDIQVTRNLTTSGGFNFDVGNGSEVSVGGDLSVDLGSNFNASNSNLVQVSGDVDIDNISQISSSQVLEVGGNWVNNGTFVHNDGTVNFNGTGLQTVNNGGVGSFYNFSHDSGSILSLIADTDVDGDFEHVAGTLNMVAQNLFVAGDFTNTSTFLTGTGVITLDGGDSDVNSTQAFNNLVVNTTGTKTFLQNSTDVDGDLTVTGTMDANNNLSVAGDYDDTQGTVNVNTLTLDGGDSDVNSTQAFNNLVVNTTGTKTFLQNSTDVDGDLTVTGTMDANNNLSVAGDYDDTQGTVNVNTLTLDGGDSDVNFNQSATNSRDLIIAATGEKTALSNVRVRGSLNVDGGTFDLNNNTLTVDDDFNITGGTYLARNGLQTFSSDLNISGGSFIGQGDINLSGDFYLLGGGVFNVNSTTANWNIFGSRFEFVNGDNFSHLGNTFFRPSNSDQVRFVTSVGQELEFDHLEFHQSTMVGATQTEFLFSPGMILNVSGTNTWVAEGSAAHLLVLDVDGGDVNDQWFIRMSGTPQLNYLNVSNSTHLGTYYIDPPNSLEGVEGSTILWFTPPQTPSNGTNSSGVNVSVQQCSDSRFNIRSSDLDSCEQFILNQDKGVDKSKQDVIFMGVDQTDLDKTVIESNFFENINQHRLREGVKLNPSGNTYHIVASLDDEMNEDQVA